MTLNCKFCIESFASVDIRSEVAFKECMDKLISHVAKKHEKELSRSREKLQQATTLVISLTTLETMVAIPENETWMLEQVTAYHNALNGLLGMNVAKV